MIVYPSSNTRENTHTHTHTHHYNTIAANYTYTNRNSNHTLSVQTARWMISRFQLLLMNPISFFSNPFDATSSTTTKTSTLSWRFPPHLTALLRRPSTCTTLPPIPSPTVALDQRRRQPFAITPAVNSPSEQATLVRRRLKATRHRACIDTREWGAGRGGSLRLKLEIPIRMAPGCGLGLTSRLRMRLWLMTEPLLRCAAQKPSWISRTWLVLPNSDASDG